MVQHADGKSVVAAFREKGNTLQRIDATEIFAVRRQDELETCLLA